MKSIFQKDVSVWISDRWLTVDGESYEAKVLRAALEQAVEDLKTVQKYLSNHSHVDGEVVDGTDDILNPAIEAGKKALGQ